MAGGAALSWMHELRPMGLSPWEMTRDLVECWRDYRRNGIPAPQATVFLGMRVVQRASYWVGWRAGGVLKLKNRVRGRSGT